MTQDSQASGTTITPVTSSVTSDSVTPDLEVTSVNNQITRPKYSAALPGEEAYVVNDNSQVLKINSTGHSVKVLYDCNSCNSI